ncbi:MAG: peptidyl-tRNA hydrolase-like protein [Candidatus Saganbacteria bacterium]|uniref:Peptidyl-tRNA hydrolase-like protein n=1 Tax=Candidatus Saganbacteria bacterium TaxID=2575572 RepID=A0A833NRA0_UNCSA|nr:MAG: peptidyl-tRNA hydrolase-like protein [Candidatus Saganbacteria bacterium]
MSVNPDKKTNLENRLLDLGICKSDVIEKFIRSGGRGGQNVNKTSTCVYLKHTPTGIEVKMAKERSQALNRFLAWRLLADKIENKALGEKSKKRQEIEKIRRQKRKRSKRAKEKILHSKKMESNKKQMRQVKPSEFEY